MRLKKGECHYTLKPLHQLIDVTLRVGKLCMKVNLVYPDVFVKVRSKLRGVPTICAYFEGQLFFDPIPDKAYTAIVRYVPPIEEM